MIEIRHLRNFVVVAEELHFTRASRLLHLAQPALSQSIRQLEEEIGAQLIVRSTRRVELTEAGRSFYDHARMTLQSLNRGVASALKMARESQDILVFGFTSAGMYGRVPDLIRQFRDRVKDTQLVFREFTADDVLAALRANTIELGVLHGQITDPLLSGITVDREVCILAIPARHKLARLRRRIALAELGTETLLMPQKTSFHGLYEEITAACIRAGINPPMSGLAPGAHALIGLVEAEAGVAIVPSSITLARKGVVYRKLVGEPIAVERRLYWQKHGRSNAVEQFVQLVASRKSVEK